MLPIRNFPLWILYLDTKAPNPRAKLPWPLEHFHKYSLASVTHSQGLTGRLLHRPVKAYNFIYRVQENQTCKITHSQCQDARQITSPDSTKKFTRAAEYSSNLICWFTGSRCIRFPMAMHYAFADQFSSRKKQFPNWGLI